MLGAIDEAEEYLGGRDLGAYRTSKLTRRSVERCLTIISEASRHVPGSMTDRYPEIPWPAIRDIGNVLRHRYYAVPDHVIWRTATFSLAELRPVVVSLLAGTDPDLEEI